LSRLAPDSHDQGPAARTASHVRNHYERDAAEHLPLRCVVPRVQDSADSLQRTIVAGRRSAGIVNQIDPSTSAD
jgi:hypothetical protein